MAALWTDCRIFALALGETDCLALHLVAAFLPWTETAPAGRCLHWQAMEGGLPRGVSCAAFSFESLVTFEHWKNCHDRGQHCFAGCGKNRKGEKERLEGHFSD